MQKKESHSLSDMTVSKIFDEDLAMLKRAASSPLPMLSECKFDGRKKIKPKTTKNPKLVDSMLSTMAF